MKFPALLPLAALLALGLAACGPKKDPEPAKPKVTAAQLVPLGPAPAWKLKDVNGNVVTSDQFKDKVVVLDFWATWCGPCRMEIPGYTDLQRKYGKDGFVVVGVSVDDADTVPAVKEFIAKNGMNYPVVMADPTILAAYGNVEFFPTTFLIDRAGQIRDRKIGVEPTADYEQKVAALLN
ncbi:MAG TPA: TlpA disulfide reductase family protein [Opitutaceae bacterium]|nr:TlpA disulfide reductase family protein [Opitutaceae bacterium]